MKLSELLRQLNENCVYRNNRNSNVYFQHWYPMNYNKNYCTIIATNKQGEYDEILCNSCKNLLTNRNDYLIIDNIPHITISDELQTLKGEMANLSDQLDKMGKEYNDIKKNLEHLTTSTAELYSHLGLTFEFIDDSLEEISEEISETNNGNM